MAEQDWLAAQRLTFPAPRLTLADPVDPVLPVGPAHPHPLDDLGAGLAQDLAAVTRVLLGLGEPPAPSDVVAPEPLVAPDPVVPAPVVEDVEPAPVPDPFPEPARPRPSSMLDAVAFLDD